ncbi:DUF2500 domain-containing protein [Bacillus carboniphilus]|uniref:DUF2500 domain-containing protein n=1 Tax=Bacillus carboniphilus TaxID=86663 RepID=UPI003531CD13
MGRNNKQPVLTVPARIASKRHHQGRETSTSYYVTFEVVSGDRMEFHVSSSEFGMLSEDDIGYLTFQGTRYHRFERNVS